MFRKAPKIKSQTTLRNSDRRKLRSDILSQIPTLSTCVDNLFSSKDDFTAIKLTSFQGNLIQVYVKGGNPLFFETEGLYYPTVYLLWTYPELIHLFATWPPVFSKLQDGADLMLPGVISDGNEIVTAESLGCLSEGQVCGVKIIGNRSAVAVGKATISSSDMVKAGMRGKGVTILHTYKDHLWAMGMKAEVPMVVEADVFAIVNKERDKSQDGAELTNNSETNSDAINMLVSDSKADNKGVVSEQDKDDNLTQNEASTDSSAEPRGASTVNDLAMRVDEDVKIQDVKDDDSSVRSTDAKVGVETGKSAKEEMDDLLTYCLLCALKTKLKESHLPVSSSDLYTQFMKPCCPKSKSMDVKKSTYKKFSRFLEAMQQQSLLEIKRVSDDVSMITAVNWPNPVLKSFVPQHPSKEDHEEEETDNQQITAGGYRGPPDIVEVYLVTAAVLRLFQPNGFQKGSALTGQEVRNCVSQYVRDKQLQDDTNKSQVKLDEILAHILLRREEYAEVMRWDEIFSRVYSLMTTGYKVTFPGEKTQLKRGKLQPISLDVVQRAANKKATIVSNLDAYGIDPSEFAKTMQHTAACSTSVVKDQSGTTSTVQIQGNQIHLAGTLLRDKYNLPHKYITGLEKAVKQKKV